jgi:hypothetical protein
MALNALLQLWASIEADLSRARGTLPHDAESHGAIREYEEYINHNELVISDSGELFLREKELHA